MTTSADGVRLSPDPAIIHYYDVQYYPFALYESRDGSPCSRANDEVPEGLYVSLADYDDVKRKLAEVEAENARLRVQDVLTPAEILIARHIVKRAEDECGKPLLLEFMQRVMLGEHDVPSPWFLMHAHALTETPDGPIEEVGG